MSLTSFFSFLWRAAPEPAQRPAQCPAQAPPSQEPAKKLSQGQGPKFAGATTEYAGDTRNFRVKQSDRASFQDLPKPPVMANVPSPPPGLATQPAFSFASTGSSSVGSEQLISHNYTTSLASPFLSDTCSVTGNVKITDAASLPSPPLTPKGRYQASCHEEEINASSPPQNNGHGDDSADAAQPKPQAKDDIVIGDGIVIEQDDDLPPGYIVTVDGQRFLDPNHNCLEIATCGLGVHKLVCGHWVDDKSSFGFPKPCGVNCDKPNFDEQAFRCLRCRVEIYVALQTKLSTAEQRKLEALQKLGQAQLAMLVGYIVEVLSRHMILPHGATEIVMWIMTGSMDGDEYGRACNAAKDPEYTPPTPEETASEWRAAKNRVSAKNKRQKEAEEEKGRKNLRKRSLDTGSDRPTSKKRKAKFCSHTPPIPEGTRGTKRPSTAFSPENSSNPKRIMTTPRPTFGKPSFATPPPSILGPLIRKREGTDVLIETAIQAESKKRSCIARIGEGVPSRHRFDLRVTLLDDDDDL